MNGHSSFNIHFRWGVSMVFSAGDLSFIVVSLKVAIGLEKLIFGHLKNKKFPLEAHLPVLSHLLKIPYSNIFTTFMSHIYFCKIITLVSYHIICQENLYVWILYA